MRGQAPVTPLSNAPATDSEREGFVMKHLVFEILAEQERQQSVCLLQEIALSQPNFNLGGLSECDIEKLNGRE